VNQILAESQKSADLYQNEWCNFSTFVGVTTAVISDCTNCHIMHISLSISWFDVPANPRLVG